MFGTCGKSRIVNANLKRCAGLSLEATPARPLTQENPVKRVFLTDRFGRCDTFVQFGEGGGKFVERG